MVCQTCSNDNPDGKLFCGDCGSPISPSVTYFERKIEENVQNAINAQFRDQRLVAIDTATEVLKTITHRAKTYLWWIGGPVTLILIILGMFGLDRYHDLGRKLDVVQRLQPTIDAAKNQAEEARIKATEAAQKASQAKDDISKAEAQAKEDISKATFGLSSNASTATQHIATQVTTLDEKFGKARADIDAQQQRIASTDELVSTLFSKGKFSSFAMSGWSGNPPGSGNFEVLEHGDVQAIYMIISDPPIYQTLQIQWGLFILPKSDMGINRNLVQLRWDKKRGDFRANPLDLSYVPNTLEKFRFKALSVKNNTVYADDTVPLEKFWPGKD